MRYLMTYSYFVYGARVVYLVILILLSVHHLRVFDPWGSAFVVSVMCSSTKLFDYVVLHYGDCAGGWMPHHVCSFVFGCCQLSRADTWSFLCSTCSRSRCARLGDKYLVVLATRCNHGILKCCQGQYVSVVLA